MISSRLLFFVHVLDSLLSVSHYSLRFSAGSIFLLTSSFIHLQLFFSHTTGHTPPISQKTSEPKVHEVSRNPRIVRCIEPSSHFCYLSCFVFLVVDGSAVERPPFPVVFRRVLYLLLKPPCISRLVWVYTRLTPSSIIIIAQYGDASC